MKMMTVSQQKMEADDKEASPAKAQKKKRKRKRKPKMIMLGPEARHTEDYNSVYILLPCL